MKKRILAALFIACLLVIGATNSAQALPLALSWSPVDPPYSYVSLVYGTYSPSYYFNGADYSATTAFVKLIITNDYAPGTLGISLESSSLLTEKVFDGGDAVFPLYFSNVLLHPSADSPVYPYEIAGEYWYDAGRITVEALETEEATTPLATEYIDFQVRVSQTPEVPWTPESTIPEPATCILLPIGLGVEAFRRRMKK